MASPREGGGCSLGNKYDVFLSFRGPDTRHCFVDCLYEAMIVVGIRVFIDNERLHVGEVIGEELMRAIDDSKICMPVFSKSYASSKWCLLELEHIMMGRIGHEVLPIFYDVTPDDVKLQTRLYSDDLEVLEKDQGIDAADRWRKCLKEVRKIKGWNLEESRGQGKMIKRIVQEVLYKTKKKYKNVTNHLVGIEGQIEAMMELLDDRIDHVRFVIIHGMGGIGKTTLAKVIFNNVSTKFQGCSFLSNVRESSQGNGIVKLQQQILNDVLRMSVSIFDVDDGVNEIRERCSNKRVLLVLDDIEDTEQVGKLAGMFDWFGRGSRIIITTRDVNVIPNELLSYNAREKNQNPKTGQGDDHENIHYYKMREMDDQYATALFQRYTFSDDGNSFNDGELLQEIVASTGGLPLALEVVGLHLFGKTEAVWRETLKKLRQAPHKKVQNALMISYEALEDNEKQIFLDIACFFRGIERHIVMYIWEAADLYPESGVNALLHKSLIKIDDGDRIWMHDQLRDLGREIIRRDGKSCRIWIHEEAVRMMSTEKGTRDVILLDLGELSRSCKLKKAAFEELVNLRVLRLEGGNLVGDFSNYFPQLMWLEWRSFPSNFQAQNFSPPNLVVLRFAKTDIDERWTGWKGLLGSKLKFLELSGCGELTRTPDFSTCLGLEMLVLKHNKRLIEIDSSIGKLEQLLHLEIKGSPNLRCLPRLLALRKRMEKFIVTRNVHEVYPVKFHPPIEFDNLKSLCHLAIGGVELESLPKGIGQLKQLKYLSLARCRHLTSLPESVWELESLVELNLTGTGLNGFSGKIRRMKELKVLNLSRTNIRTLPKGIGGLVKLEELNLSFCLGLEQIPSEIGNLFSLRVLNLGDTGIVELPSSVIQLSRLQHLYMDSCLKLRKVGQLPTSLSHLHLPYISLQFVPDLSNLVNIVQLTLLSHEVSINYHGPPIMDDEEDQRTRLRSLDFAWIERLPKLKRLAIEVPSDVFNSLEVELRSIWSVELRLSCSNAQSLSRLPHNFSGLILKKFWATTLDLSLFPNLKNLSELYIDGLSIDKIELRGLEVLGNLQKIGVWNCQSLARLSIASCSMKLNSLGIMDCPTLVEVEGVSRLESLQTLWFFGCLSLSRLSDLSNLVKLKVLYMDDCGSIEKMPALPRKEKPFNLLVRNCGKLRDFDGPHDLYVDIIEGPDKCIILRRWIKCISDLFLFCFCLPQNDFKGHE